MKKHLFSVLLAGAALLGSCEGGGNSPDNPSNEFITVADGKTSLTLAAGDTSVSGGITIVTKDAWTSYIEEVTKADATWISISPSSGDAAGTYTIAVTIEPNKTGKSRKAQIVITCGTGKITITVEQRAEGDDPTPPTPPTPSDEYKRLASMRRYTENWSEYGEEDDDYEEMILTYGTDKRVVEIRDIYNDGGGSTDIVDETVYKIEYFENAMRITETGTWDSGSDKAIYDITLNDKGYASQVKYSDYDNITDSTPSEVRNYMFEYTGDDRLSKVSWEYSNSRYWYMYSYASGVLSTISTNLSDSSENNPVGLEANFGSVANNTMNIDILPLFQSLVTADGGYDYYVGGVVNILTFLRLAGKGCDRLPAYGYASDDDEVGYPDPGYTTPNQRYHESDTYFDTESDGKLEYTFNADNTVKSIVRKETVKKIRHDYDVVVGSEVIEQREEGWDSENNRPIIVYYYDSWTENHEYTTLASGENRDICDFTYVE